MDNHEIVIVVKNKLSYESALAFSEKTKIPIVQQPGDQLTLCYDENGISLSGYGMTYRGDFVQMMRRVDRGKLQHEMLVKAARSKTENVKIMDATAGMGEDSFLLAASGCNVTLFEKNPVIAELLKDAVKRAGESPETKAIVGRMNVIAGNSITDIDSMPTADIVYLDPMFPERKKSGLIGKKLQLLQKLVSPCNEEIELYNAALSRNPEKIIVKRPLKGPYLADKKPTYTLSGKSIRYDCYVL